MSLFPSIPLQEIKINSLINGNVILKMARIDQLSPLASGNKIYKLNSIFNYAKANNFKQILSFGGAFSNHIHALALMAQQHDIESIAMIRGEQVYAENPTLSDVRKAGMILEFVNRDEYKLRNNQDYLAQLQIRFPKALIISEGGSSQLAIQGCAQLARDINLSLNPSTKLTEMNDILAVASGTGATAAGLVCGLEDNQSVIAYSVLKDKSLESRIDAFIDAEKSKNSKRYVIQQADFGGYAKFDKPLLDFILRWYEQTGILLDPIYTSKLCLRLIEQIEAGEFAHGQSITIIHSGGLQGWRGMQERVVKLGGEAAWNQIDKLISF